MALSPFAQTTGEPRVLDFSVVDPAKVPDWDHRLLAHPEATIFHTAAWAEVLKQAYGFSAQYIVQESRGDRIGLLALMETRGMLGQRRGINLPFTDSCPMLLPSGESAEEVSWGGRDGPETFTTASAGLVAQARRLGQARRWRSIEFRPASRPAADGTASVRFLSHEVSLTSSDTAQRDLCLPATRRTLRQAQSSPLTVTVGLDRSFIDAYYQLHCDTRKRQGAPPQPYGFFLELERQLLARNLGFVVLATQAGRPVAGAVFLKFGRRAVYKFGASDASSLAFRPNQLVMWTGLRHAAEIGCTSLDFGRTSTDNLGLRQFKMGWGAVESHLAYQCYDIQTGQRLFLDDRTQGWQSRLFRRMPVCAGRLAGTLLYRFAA